MIRSLSISGVLTLNLHSLNNEGTEGNQQLTRQVEIASKDGFCTVNAISGDMFKHAQCEYLRDIALEMKLRVCGPSARSDANRINADEDFTKLLKENPGGKGKKPKLPGSVLLDEILKRCAVTDCEGTLVVAEGYSVPRKSCVEFGWIVGRPDRTRTHSYVHVKYDPESRGSSTGEEGLGQALFYRPANSGQYSTAVHIEFDRVGRNDITLSYTIDETERRKRTLALLQSVVYTFVRPRGAHRNTQLPHVLEFEGAISTSTGPVPAPSVSSLANDYRDRIAKVTERLNALTGAATIRTVTFDTVDEFVARMHAIAVELESL
jgi:CRISPR-associated protein Cst2